MQELIVEECGCHFTSYLSITSATRACFNLTELNCVYAQIAAFVIDETCSRLCPLECDTVTYDILTTNLVFPSESLYNLLQVDTNFVKFFADSNNGANLSLENMRENLISLKVYYPLTQYTAITEVPKVHLFELFAQIGGSMGMLLGFSVFHFVEFFEVILLIVVTYFRY